MTPKNKKRLIKGICVLRRLLMMTIIEFIQLGKYLVWAPFTPFIYFYMTFKDKNEMDPKERKLEKGLHLRKISIRFIGSGIFLLQRPEIDGSLIPSFKFQVFLMLS